MKKLMYALSATLLFVACSKDDAPATESTNQESTNLDTTVLLRKSTETYDDGSSATYLLSYNGTKINSAINKDDDGEKTIFTYTGDLITTIEEYEDNKIVYTENYFYKNGKIDYIESITSDSYSDYDYSDDELYSRKFKTLKSNRLKSSNRKSEYVNSIVIKDKQQFTYNNDGTISVEESDYDNDTKTYVKNPMIAIHNLSNNTIIETEFKSTVINEDFPIAMSATIKYSYDDKNNPLRNVTGLANTMRFDYSVHNLTSISIKTNTDLSKLDETEKAFYNQFVNSLASETTISYAYNDKGFPTAGTAKFKTGNISITNSATFEY